MFRRYLRRFPVVPFIGPGSARKRPVWSDDIVDGLARIVGNPVCFGKTYNLSGREPITMRELGKLMLAAGGGAAAVPAPAGAAVPGAGRRARRAS